MYPGVFFVILIALFEVKKTGFKIGQQNIYPLIITGPLHFQYPIIFFMRLVIFHLRLIDISVTAVLKVQASVVGLDVPKYPQKVQNKAKITLVL